jgi:hypothetical protein
VNILVTVRNKLFPHALLYAKQWNGLGELREIVYTMPTASADMCTQCKKSMAIHGQMILNGVHEMTVCPGDWVLKIAENSYISCSDRIFRERYEVVHS